MTNHHTPTALRRAAAVTAAAALAAGVLLAVPAAATATTTPGADVRAIATGITASSIASGATLDGLQDGNYDAGASVWSPSTTPTAGSPAWLRLDFGADVDLGALEVDDTSAGGVKSYTIEVSADGSTWTQVAAETLATPRSIIAEWETVSARYLRLAVTSVFAGTMGVSEVSPYSDLLPHRTGVLSCYPDLQNFGAAGLEALHRQGSQLLNLCVLVADPSNTELSVLPDLVDDAKYPNGIASEDALDYVSDPDNYVWDGVDALMKKFTDDGFDIWLGFQGYTERAFPDFYKPAVDESNREIDQRDFFDPTNNAVAIEVAKQVMAHFDGNPFIRAFSILGPGFYGGIEFYSGSGPELNAVYSDNAKARFREWLAARYTTIGALNTAWGTSYSSFSQAQPPLPDRAGSGPADTRPSWADLMRWKQEYMQQFLVDYATSVRSATDKPFHVEVDGGYQSAPMETGESMGQVAHWFAGVKNVVFGNSNLDASYGIAQYSATARFYGYAGTMDDTGQGAQKAHQDILFNFLGYGVNSLSHKSLGVDYTEWDETTGTWNPSGSYTGTDIYRYTADNYQKILQLDPKYEGSDVVIFNPFYANLFRYGYNRNDHNFIYNADQGINWFGTPFASWAHYLDSPDILDDFPIEDGALDDYKVLITPNTGSVLTSSAAESKIEDWIDGGGAFVGFGENAFTYSYDLTANRVSGSTAVSDWMMGHSGGTAKVSRTGTKIRVATGAPAWLTSLAAGAEVSVSGGGSAFSALASGAVPVLVDEAGNAIMVQVPVGDGMVLFSTMPVADNAMFSDAFMSRILSDFVDSRDITRTVRVSDPDKYYVIDAGIDRVSGKRLVMVARNAGTTDADPLVITHDPSLDGTDALINLSWMTGFPLIEHTFQTGEDLTPIEQRQIAGFDTGDWSETASVSTAAFGSTPSTGTSGGVAAAYSGGYASSTAGGGDKKGTLKTKPFTVDLSTLTFMGAGWNGTAYGPGAWPYALGNRYNLRNATTDALLISEEPKNRLGDSTTFTRYNWDLSAYLGQSVYFEIVDDIGPSESAIYGGGFDWLAADDVRLVGVAAPQEQVVGFDTGDWSETTSVSAVAFGSAPSTGTAGGVASAPAGAYASSAAGGGDKKGSLKTNAFTIDRPTLSFLGAGWNGTAYGPGAWPYALGNRFNLRDATTHALLISAPPENRLGDSSAFTRYAWDVRAYAGRSVYFEVVDDIGPSESAVYGGGFDWLAVDDIRLIGNSVP